MENYQDYIGSFSFDQRLAPYDIEGSIAHVRMLMQCRIIPASDGKTIIKGLTAIAADIAKGKAIPKEEDIHYAIEKELIRRIGPAGGKMHTARSRNDQVALDLRLYLRAEINIIIGLLRRLQKALTVQAEQYKEVVMPGYTHLQPAQPVLFAHHLLAYAWMFERDIERLTDALKRVCILPLGSAALAGTSFPIDRNYVAKLLGFAKVGENSMDGVSARDFAIEFLSDSSIIAMHLSRLAEELIVWSSAEFEFVRLADEFTSGSSIMPQKRNPDVAEIVRGKSGRIYGDLIAMLTIMKSLPLAYNRDMQEDKPPVFDAVDAVKGNLDVMGAMIATMRINPDRMLKATEKGYLAATELADYLTRRGMPFRQAHGIVKEVVHYCINSRKTLSELTIEELKKFSRVFEKEVLALLPPHTIIRRKVSAGSTSAASVAIQLRQMKQLLKTYERK
jgi:argininosuccinate lyase